MAIGSEPEIGVQFAQWGNMDAMSQQAWFAHLRGQTHLLQGYATVCYPRVEMVDRINKEWSSV